MPDIAPAAVRQGLEPYGPWFDRYFQRPDGKPFSERTRRRKAKELNLPTVRVGWALLIDPVLAERKLRENAHFDGEPVVVKRGRPRTRVA
jgi:hypothetical protein